MKSFEYEIRRRVLVLTLFSTISALLLIAAFLLKQSGYFGTKGLSVANIIGLFAGIESVSILRIRNYRKALKNSDSLEELHIEETDERNRILTQKTCKSCIYLTFALLGFFGVITSFFNQTVFYTISAILILLLVMYLVLRVYYSHKY